MHHVFVTDLEGRPIRVLTPTDVLRALALPAASNMGWRFQAAELHSSYSYDDSNP